MRGAGKGRMKGRGNAWEVGGSVGGQRARDNQEVENYRFSITLLLHDA